MADFRSLSSVAYGGGGARTSTVISPPAGIVDGDILILVCLFGGSASPVLTLPAGFALLPGFPTDTVQGGFKVTAHIAFKVASGESGDYTVAHITTPGNTEALMFAVSGGATSGIQATRNQWSGLNGLTTTALGLTTGGDSSLVAFIAHNWELYGSGSPPGGSTPTFTERFDSGTNLLYLATGVLASTGATGDKVQSVNDNASDGSDAWQAFLLEIPNSSAPSFKARAYYDLIGS